jgi:hypothetical protein
MAQLYANNAVVYLNSGISNSDTVITIQSGQGSILPVISNTSDFFLLTLYQLVNGVEFNHEIIKVTARSGDILSVLRGQEGTTARVWPISSPLECRITAKSMRTVSADALFTNPPKTITTTTYTVVDGDISLVFSNINSTITLPNPATHSGRILFIRNKNLYSDYGANQETSLVSSSANVLTLDSTSPGTNIIPASSGKFVILQSDGTNWIVIAGN